MAVGVAVVGGGHRRPGTGRHGSLLGMAVRMVGADEHRSQRDDADGEGRHTEADGRHLGATANERDEGGNDGDRTERGARCVGELRVLGDLQTVDPADAPQPRRSPSRHGAEVDEGRDHCGQATTLDKGEQADPDLGDGDGDEQPSQRDVLGVQSGDPGVDRPGTDRGEAGELHDADGDRHRPLPRRRRRRRGWWWERVSIGASPGTTDSSLITVVLLAPRPPWRAGQASNVTDGCVIIRGAAYEMRSWSAASPIDFLNDARDPQCRAQIAGMFVR